jgi:ribosomal protein L37E
MENCPICNNEITENNIKDYGYNTFNVGTVSCHNCGFSRTYNCVEEKKTYINLWNKDILNLNSILNLSDKDKNIFFKYLFLNKPNELIKNFEKWSILNSLKENIENDLNIIKKNDLNLKINEEGKILVSASLLNHGYEKYLKSLGLKLEIKKI